VILPIPTRSCWFSTQYSVDVNPNLWLFPPEYGYYPVFGSRKSYLFSPSSGNLRGSICLLVNSSVVVVLFPNRVGISLRWFISPVEFVVFYPVFGSYKSPCCFVLPVGVCALWYEWIIAGCLQFYPSWVVGFYPVVGSVNLLCPQPDFWYSTPYSVVVNPNFSPLQS
jgi:hypothetical protein